MTKFEELKALIAATDADIQKFEGGNKAAGTRVRNAMQEVKKLAQGVREAVLEQKKA